MERVHRTSAETRTTSRRHVAKPRCPRVRDTRRCRSTSETKHREKNPRVRRNHHPQARPVSDRSAQLAEMRRKRWRRTLTPHSLSSGRLAQEPRSQPFGAHTHTVQRSEGPKTPFAEGALFESVARWRDLYRGVWEKDQQTGSTAGSDCFRKINQSHGPIRRVVFERLRHIAQNNYNKKNAAHQGVE